MPPIPKKGKRPVQKSVCPMPPKKKGPTYKELLAHNTLLEDGGKPSPVRLCVDEILESGRLRISVKGKKDVVVAERFYSADRRRHVDQSFSYLKTFPALTPKHLIITGLTI